MTILTSRTALTLLNRAATLLCVPDVRGGGSGTLARALTEQESSVLGQA